MPMAHRLGDSCTGHSCFPPRPNAQGSPDVTTNNLAQHRVGDGWMTHCCGSSCHGASTASGSSTVTVNNKPAARIGDSVSCGSSCATGSSDVFIGG